uniref:Uncharacterized protein n=1 Tax=Timema shepardi TaxID=629360 RepID=A0A7R9B670_TIMSH|nr:unnamed protein product [Timema shepardi]
MLINRQSSGGPSLYPPFLVRRHEKNRVTIYSCLDLSAHQPGARENQCAIIHGDSSPDSERFHSTDVDSGNSTAHSPDGPKSTSPLLIPQESLSPISPSSCGGVPFGHLELLEATHRGLHKFVPRHHDEIEVEIGDPIYVQREAEDLWSEGEIVSKHKSLYYPKYSSLVASLLLIDSSQLTSDSQHSGLHRLVCFIKGVNLRSGRRGIFPSAYAVDTDYSDFDPSSPQVKRERYLLGYLGSVETLCHKGTSVLCQAVRKIVGTGKLPKHKPHSCVLEVSDQGLRMLDRSKPSPRDRVHLKCVLEEAYPTFQKFLPSLGNGDTALVLRAWTGATGQDRGEESLDKDKPFLHPGRASGDGFPREIHHPDGLPVETTPDDWKKAAVSELHCLSNSWGVYCKAVLNIIPVRDSCQGGEIHVSRRPDSVQELFSGWVPGEETITPEVPALLRILRLGIVGLFHVQVFEGGRDCEGLQGSRRKSTPPPQAEAPADETLPEPVAPGPSLLVEYPTKTTPHSVPTFTPLTPQLVPLSPPLRTSQKISYHSPILPLPLLPPPHPTHSPHIPRATGADMVLNQGTTIVLIGCDFKAEHPSWGSRIMCARGRLLYDVIDIHGLEPRTLPPPLPLSSHTPLSPRRPRLHFREMVQEQRNCVWEDNIESMCVKDSSLWRITRNLMRVSTLKLPIVSRSGEANSNQEKVDGLAEHLES